MGKTPVPLTIYVWAPWLTNPDVIDLGSHGHRVVPWHDHPGSAPDLILHPQAHRWAEEFFDGTLLGDALKSARARRKRMGKAEVAT